MLDGYPSVIPSRRYRPVNNRTFHHDLSHDQMKVLVSRGCRQITWQILAIQGAACIFSTSIKDFDWSFGFVAARRATTAGFPHLDNSTKDLANSLLDPANTYEGVCTRRIIVLSGLAPNFARIMSAPRQDNPGR
ncbi:hypothetical protein ONS96_003894 [Cadophora gregata f. sp. sojae]|nr:hypothetical protein ONS96_003894 [Cadophora gregata f. sp. sojae]